METLNLNADQRAEKGKKVKKIRHQGLIPAVVYGPHIKELVIAVNAKMFRKVISGGAGSNAIINLKINGDGEARELPVITYAIQRDPLSDEILHIDFRNISMTEKIKAKVPVELHGIPAGVKDGGVLVHGLREIEVECLPGNIPDKFEIDVSDLIINHSKRVSDLVVLEGVSVLSDAAELIAFVSTATKEEVVVAAAVEGAEGAPLAEGAPAAAGAGEKAGAAEAKPGAEKGKPTADKKAESAKK